MQDIGELKSVMEVQWSSEEGLLGRPRFTEHDAVGAAQELHVWQAPRIDLHRYHKAVTHLSHTPVPSQVPGKQ